MGDVSIGDILANMQLSQGDPQLNFRLPESRPLRFGTDLPLAELLRMLPQNSMTDFFLGLDPRLRFSAAAQTPWDFPPELSLGFSVGKRW